MLDRSALVGKHSRESGGVRYAGFRVLRGGEEPRRHGTAVEKQPAAAAPAHTVTPLRRRLAALGRSSLRRSSAHTVFRMAMRRSNLPDTPKFLIDPARNSTGGNDVIEDTSKATIVQLRDHRQHARGRDSACSISIVDRRKLIVSRTHDVERRRRDASSNLPNSTSSVDAYAERFFNRTNITLLDSNKYARKWRVRNKLTVVVPDWITEYPLCNIAAASSKECRDNEIFCEIAGSSKLLAGVVVKQARSTLDRSVGRNSRRWSTARDNGDEETERPEEIRNRDRSREKTKVTRDLNAKRSNFIPEVNSVLAGGQVSAKRRNDRKEVTYTPRR
ncbi:hypothetical protein K0M31_012952 [Melipona bicolor]|uniref:Uncharacterized protein n=1 Tax=Melipona bicolor TaxID=60889 RepID=A0AA40KGZ1_9HYME|nr:hypothetical protein K0M31_012952 [Melipona bicolor]